MAVFWKFQTKKIRDDSVRPVEFLVFGGDLQLISKIFKTIKMGENRHLETTPDAGCVGCLPYDLHPGPVPYKKK